MDTIVHEYAVSFSTSGSPDKTYGTLHFIEHTAKFELYSTSKDLITVDYARYQKFKMLRKLQCGFSLDISGLRTTIRDYLGNHIERVTPSMPPRHSTASTLLDASTKRQLLQSSVGTVATAATTATLYDDDNPMLKLINMLYELPPPPKHTQDDTFTQSSPFYDEDEEVPLAFKLTVPSAPVEQIVEVDEEEELLEPTDPLKYEDIIDDERPLDEVPILPRIAPHTSTHFKHLEGTKELVS